MSAPYHPMWSPWQLGAIHARSNPKAVNPFNKATDPEAHADWFEGARQAGIEARSMTPDERRRDDRLRQVQGFGYFLVRE